MIENFARNLTRLRQMKNISQLELADHIGVGKATISKIELGTSYLRRGGVSDRTPDSSRVSRTPRARRSAQRAVKPVPPPSPIRTAGAGETHSAPTRRERPILSTGGS